MVVDDAIKLPHMLTFYKQNKYIPLSSVLRVVEFSSSEIVTSPKECLADPTLVQLTIVVCDMVCADFCVVDNVGKWLQSAIATRLVICIVYNNNNALKVGICRTLCSSPPLGYNTQKQ